MTLGSIKFYLAVKHETMPLLLDPGTRQNEDDGGKAMGEPQRKTNTPAQGCLHGAESWEPTTPFLLPCKDQPLSLKYQPLSLFFTDFLGKGRFCLDQEMSLLSHVELSAEAKWEERAAEEVQTFSKLLLLERPSLQSHCYLKLAAWGEHHFVIILRQLFKCCFHLQQLGWR